MTYTYDSILALLLKPDYLAVKDTSDDAFSDACYCECVYAGSSDYYDRGMEQWYPGDDPEFEVTGYADYIQYCIDGVVDDVMGDYPDIDKALLTKVVTENLSDIYDEFLLDEDEFEERGIDEYEFPDYYPED